MAVRTPLYLDGTDLKEMSSSMISNIKSRCVYMYGADPSVDIAVVGSGGNISPNMTDTRTQAGAAGSSYSNFSFSIAGVSTVTVNYDRITQNVESVSQDNDTNNIRNFIYQSSGNLYAMSHTDMYDTFYNDVLNTIVDGSDRPGTYRVATSTSQSNMTLVSSTPVFQDTRANAGAYTSGGIPETLDQPTTIANYYVHRVNQSIMSNPSITAPMYIRSDGNIQQYTDSQINTILQNDIRYWGNQKIRYSVNGTGNNRGSGMSNTKLNSSTRSNRQDGTSGSPSTQYRSQQFPSGSAVTNNTYYLRIYRNS